MSPTNDSIKPRRRTVARKAAESTKEQLTVDEAPVVAASTTAATSSQEKAPTVVDDSFSRSSTQSPTQTSVPEEMPQLKRRGRPRKNPPKESEKTAEGESGKKESSQESAAKEGKDSAEKPAVKLASASGKEFAKESEKTIERTVTKEKKDIGTPALPEIAVPYDSERQPHVKGYSRNRGSSSNGKSQNGTGGKSGHQQQNGYQQQRRPRRTYPQNAPSREQIAPQVSREDLAELKVAELREKATDLGLDTTQLKKKDELAEAVFDAMVKAEGFVECIGILDLLPEGYGFLRTSGYLPSETDVYVGMSMVRRNGLRKGDQVAGQVRPARDNEKYSALHRIDTVNGLTLDELRNRRRFADLTPVYPDERLIMEHNRDAITARTIDLVAPIGKGQRGLIVSPPKAGKTTILKDIAAAISANDPKVHLMCLLVDERPEEVTDMERSIKGEVISSTFDMPSENHIAVAELVIERAKRLVEIGQDVVILLDSITRLARAYNLAQPASGRILSGGVDSTALYPPKRFLGAARNIEGGGSLTILASALIDTGSKMDEVIFEEFKGTGNMELKLDRALADRRIFPAIDPVSSGTRKEELLLDSQEAPLIWAVRRILANMNSTERSMEMLIKALKQTQNNAEFLMRTARKAQQRNNLSEAMEL